MARYIKKVSEKDLNFKQQSEAGRLGLTFVEWRWYDAIRRTKGEGAQWGCLPRYVFQTLVQKSLIVGNPAVVWVREFAPSTRQS